MRRVCPQCALDGEHSDYHWWWNPSHRCHMWTVSNYRVSAYVSSSDCYMYTCTHIGGRKTVSLCYASWDVSWGGNLLRTICHTGDTGVAWHHCVSSCGQPNSSFTVPRIHHAPFPNRPLLAVLDKLLDFYYWIHLTLVIPMGPLLLYSFLPLYLFYGRLKFLQASRKRTIKGIISIRIISIQSKCNGLGLQKNEFL